VRIYGKIAMPMRPDTCWDWVGTVNADDKPIVWYRDNQTLAHRLIYFDFLGVWIDGIRLHRTCEHAECVNPRHRQQGQ